MGKVTNQAIENLVEKKRQIEALIQKKKAKAKDDQRKLDTRKKIILGGVILAAIKAGEIEHGEARALIARYASQYAHMFPEFTGDHASEAPQEPVQGPELDRIDKG